MRSWKRVAATLTTGMMAGLLPLTGAGAVPIPCEGQALRVLRNSNETVSLRTLHIETESAKETYRVGDVAKFPALVTRPTNEDPLKLGVPFDRPTSMAAEEVNIGVGLLFANQVFLPGFAVTDAEGKTTIKVKIENYVKPGPVHASFYAWKVQADVPCARVEENGFLPIQNIFTVKK